MKEIKYFIIKHYILSISWIILLNAIIFTTLQIWFSKIKEISREEAINLINKKKAIIVDLRNKNNFYNGHIINSINITEDDIKLGNLKKLDKIEKKLLIVVCAEGKYSYKTAKILLKAGFKKTFILKDGILGWEKEHLPLVQKK